MNPINQPLVTQDGTQLDPKVVKVMQTIKALEGGNYNDRSGDNGSSAGAFQWNNGNVPLGPNELPKNWKGPAKMYLGDENAPMTKANQNKVAYHQIKAMKDAGYDPEEIDALWNGAHKDPTTGKYVHNNQDRAQKFRSVLLGGQQSSPQGQGYVTPPQSAPSSNGADSETLAQQPHSGILGTIGGALGGIAKSIIEPTTTLLTRPQQAAKSIGQYLGSNPDQLAQDSEQNVQSLIALTNLRTKKAQAGEDTSQIDNLLNKIKNEGGIMGSDYASQELSQSAQPDFSTNIPLYGNVGDVKNFGDVKKDVGRGLETAAFGLAPVAGGAIAGLGSSIEAGNPIIGAQTAFRTVAGGLLGKAAEVASPYISKAVGKITPNFVKDAVGKVGDAISPATDAIGNFAKNTEILPGPISKAINTGADYVNKAPGALWNTVAGQYGGGTSEKALRAKAQQEVSKALGNTGKKSAGVFAGNDAKRLQGLETLYDEAPNIQVKDPATDELIPYDPTTASLHQHVEALNNAKQNIYAELEKNVQLAQNGGVTVDKTQTLQSLQDIVDSPGRTAAARNTANRLISEIKRLQTPTQVQSYLQDLNAGLSGVASGSSQNISRKVEADATKQLTDSLDKTVINVSNSADDTTLKAANQYIKGTANTMKSYLTDPDVIASGASQDLPAMITRVQKNIVDGLPQQVGQKLDPKVINQIASLDPKNYSSIDDFTKDASGILNASTETNPIRVLKDKYSALKSIEQGMVSKAQQLARRPDGGLGGGLYDYINAFNLGDALDIVTNPIGAAKAGVRAGILSKLGSNKNPENLLQKIFKNIDLYKNAGKAAGPIIDKTLPNLLNNSISGGLIRSVAPPQNDYSQPRY